MLLIILLIFSALFSSSETALVSISRHKVRYLVEKKRIGSLALKKLKDDPHRLLSTILIGNNLVNVGASAIATSISIGIFENNAIGIATGVMTFLLLVFGEITPKKFAIQHKESLSLIFARPLWILSIILLPIIKFLDLLTAFIPMKKKPTITEEELRSLVKISGEEGSIKELEEKMIENIFKFDEIDAAKIMTPRRDMVCINIKATLANLLKLEKQYPFSRFPVFEKNKDNIVGIIVVKEAFKQVQKKKFTTPVEKLIRKPLFVPETKKLDKLLRNFQRMKEHMAIVVNEHGTVTGLVTLEDVLEEIVGEIVDETDKMAPEIKKISKKTWKIRGKAEIDDINEKLKTKFKEGQDFDTIGGFVLHKLGHIPKAGEKIELDNCTLIVDDVEKNRINSVRLIKK